MMTYPIHSVAAAPGWIGIAPLPGPRDVPAIADWGATLVLTMTTHREMSAPISAELMAHGIAWEHLPIPDFGAPDPDVERLWITEVSDKAHAILDAGGKVLSHCRGGCGRSGMFALRLLVERGEAPLAALARMREVRPCAVETDHQFNWAAGTPPR